MNKNTEARDQLIDYIATPGIDEPSVRDLRALNAGLLTALKRLRNYVNHPLVDAGGKLPAWDEIELEVGNAIAQAEVLQ